MTIPMAILGLLTAGPRSGYELKRLMAGSESLPWSGNNNQVYTALVALHRDGLASLEVENPGLGPSRKVYSITAPGKQALAEWLMTAPELPELRIPIMARLIGAELLRQSELESLLSDYAHELRMKVLSLEELRRRGTELAYGSDRQQAIFEAINERPIAFFRAEEEWVRNLRLNLAKQAIAQ